MSLIKTLLNKYLYHGTNIKNLDDIKQYGLIPDFGDVVKSTEAYEYYMDDDYYSEEDRIEGLVFFSDTPDTWSYSNHGKPENIDEAILVIVENNDTIFKRVRDKLFDYKNKLVDSVEHLTINELPPFIEDGDFFSLKEQTPVKILYGDKLKQFLKNNK
jgi:hypothetical protein